MLRRVLHSGLPSLGVLFALVALSLANNYEQALSQHDACRRGIAERLITIRETNVRIEGNLRIARDPSQPNVTRVARSTQAEQEERFRERRYARVDPRHGGTLVCPSASLFPHL